MIVGSNLLAGDGGKKGKVEREREKTGKEKGKFFLLFLLKKGTSFEKGNKFFSLSKKHTVIIISKKRGLQPTSIITSELVSTSE